MLEVKNINHYDSIMFFSANKRKTHHSYTTQRFLLAIIIWLVRVIVRHFGNVSPFNLVVWRILSNLIFFSLFPYNPFFHHIYPSECRIGYSHNNIKGLKMKQKCCFTTVLLVQQNELLHFLTHFEWKFLHFFSTWFLCFFLARSVYSFQSNHLLAFRNIYIMPNVGSMWFRKIKNFTTIYANLPFKFDQNSTYSLVASFCIKHKSTCSARQIEIEYQIFSILAMILYGIRLFWKHWNRFQLFVCKNGA